jgi:magnesium transporter
MPPEGTTEDRALGLIAREAWDDIRVLFAFLHPADIADIIDRAPSHTREKLFHLVGPDAKPDVLAELESVAGGDVLDALSDADVSRILEQTPPDDAADIMSSLPERRTEQILDLMPAEESEEVRELLQYAPDTAGGIMTPDVVAMKKNQTVQEALHAIAYLDSDEPFFNANVVDEKGILVGYVDIWQLLRERDRSRTLGDLAHTDLIVATTDTDQEHVTRLMSQYDLNVIPVVDAEGRLAGRITADDVMDVIEEEASEDILRLAGSDDSELEHPSVLRTCFVRLPWLLITLFGGFVVSVILKQFHAYISGGVSIETRTLALAAFVPSVLAMGGNTGIQSSTLVVRRLALDALRGRNVFGLLLREMAVGALMGCFCGVIMAFWASLVTAEPSPEAGAAAALKTYQLAIIVASALFAAMSFATLFGASVPILLNRMRIDPAVASGPFVTIANDVFALLIYFGATVGLVRVFTAG